MSKRTNFVKIERLSLIDVRDYQYIFVDEGQFFNDLYETVLTWVTSLGKNVTIASLDGDAYRKPFGRVLDLIPNADKVTKLTAFCNSCRDNVKIIKPAPFTARIKPDKTKTSKAVGGADIYRAMCRECHDMHLAKTEL